eukprot:scaffold4395_cov411-Prasinococcus_capsulatus_cf.AAC.2
MRCCGTPAEQGGRGWGGVSEEGDILLARRLRRARASPLFKRHRLSQGLRALLGAGGEEALSPPAALFALVGPSGAAPPGQKEAFLLRAWGASAAGTPRGGAKPGLPVPFIAPLARGARACPEGTASSTRY